MTPTVSTLMRHRDPSSVSGTGPVATVCEFGSGLTAVHWDTDTPSVTVYTDVRHVLQLHGHGGASTLELNYTERLLAAYQLVMPYVVMSRPEWNPLVVAPHPDHPDRLRLVLPRERVWRWWIALLDGSSDAATHEEVAGEMRHTWITPDGNVWLIYHTPLGHHLIASEAFVVPEEDPLETYDREDR